MREDEYEWTRLHRLSKDQSKTEIPAGRCLYQEKIPGNRKQDV